MGELIAMLSLRPRDPVQPKCFMLCLPTVEKQGKQPEGSGVRPPAQPREAWLLLEYRSLRIPLSSGVTSIVSLLRAYTSLVHITLSELQRISFITFPEQPLDRSGSPLTLDPFLASSLLSFYRF